jgi:TonB family protein
MVIQSLLTCVFLFVFSLCSAQVREVFGRVVDGNGKPVNAAQITASNSDSTTYTNQQGFFKILTQAREDSLFISHLGFEFVKVPIPVTNKLLARLKAKIHELPDLNLSFFAYADEETIRGDARDLNFDNNETIMGARPSLGLRSFYFELAKILKRDSLHTTLKDSTEVVFHIGKDGSVIFDQISPQQQNIIEALKKFENDLVMWQNAQQNRQPTIQTFKLRFLTSAVEEIFVVVEESATPHGGIANFYSFVGKNIKYPAEARRMGVEGKVFVQFIINKDGTITDVRVIKGIGAGCDEEAMRVVSISPPWTPGKQRGKAVKQRYTMPIIFSLGGSSNWVPHASSYYDVMRENTKYPVEARRQGVGGIVILTFRLNLKIRSIDSLRVMATPGAGCDKAVIDAIKLVPFSLLVEEAKGKTEVIAPIYFGLGEIGDNPRPAAQENYKHNLKATARQTVLKTVKVIAVGVERDAKTFGNPTARPGQPGTYVRLDNVSLNSAASFFQSFEEALKKPLRVKRLALIGRGLTEVPEGIDEMKNLKILDLERNNLTSLPTELGNLKELEMLTVPANYLATLPESIAQLKSMHVLGLAMNQFQEFPISITQLRDLKAVDLASNSLKTLPPEIGRLINLEELYLQDNQILTLPAEFFGLKKLKKIYLQGNRLDITTQNKLRQTFKNADVRF